MKWKIAVVVVLGLDFPGKLVEERLITCFLCPTYTYWPVGPCWILPMAHHWCWWRWWVIELSVRSPRSFDNGTRNGIEWKTKSKKEATNAHRILHNMQMRNFSSSVQRIWNLQCWLWHGTTKHHGEVPSKKYSLSQWWQTSLKTKYVRPFRFGSRPDWSSARVSRLAPCLCVCLCVCVYGALRPPSIFWIFSFSRDVIKISIFLHFICFPFNFT